MSDNLPPNQNDEAGPTGGDAPAGGSGQRFYPYWLQQMGGWEKTPEWLYRLIQGSRGELPEFEMGASLVDVFGGGYGEGDARPEPTRPAPPEEEVPAEAAAEQELAEQSEPAPAEEKEPSPEPAEAVIPAFRIDDEQEIPEWLKNLDQGIESIEEWPMTLATTSPEEEEFAAEDEEDLWASTAEGEPSAAGEAGEPGEPGAEAKTEAAEELRADAEEALEPEAEPVPGTSALEEAEQELLDWLQSLEEAEALAESEGPAEPAEQLPAPKPEEESLGWLETQVGETPEALVDKGAMPPVEGEAPSAGGARAELPEWLQDLGAEAGEEALPTALVDQGELPEWLQEIEGAAPAVGEEELAPEIESTVEATQPPAAEEAAPEVEEEELGLESTVEAAQPPEAEEEELPDWLREMGAEVEPGLVELPAVPVEEGELSDWLQGIEEAAPEAEEEAAAPELESMAEEIQPPEAEEAEEGLPEWLQGIEEAAPEAEEEAPAPELESTVEEIQPPEVEQAEEGLPAWLHERGLEAELEEAELPATPVDEEGLPAWLQEIEEAAPETEEEAPALELESTVEAAQPPAFEEAEEGLPAWLQEIEEAAPEAEEEAPAPELESTVEEIQPPAFEEAEEGLPAWLQELDLEAELEEAELPAWLREMEEASPEIEKKAPEIESAAEAVQPPAVEEAEEELPAWLQELDLEAEIEPEAAALSAAPEEGQLPEWLQEIDEAAPEVEEEEPVIEPEAAVGAAQPPAVEEAEEELPEWLEDLGEVELPAATVEGVAEAASEEQEAIPDWLRDLDKEKESELAEGVPAEAAEGEVPEWLQDLDEEMAAETQEELSELPAAAPLAAPAAGPEDEAATVPDWLSDVFQAEELDLEEMALADLVEGGQDEPRETPEWLREGGIESAAAALEEEEAEGAAPARAGDLRPEDQEQVEVPLSLLGGEPLSEGEIPSWLAELRPREEEAAAEEQVVETSGPLAGLAGLLNPEPLLGIFPKSVYRPVPPVPEAHLAEAKAVEQVLNIPTGTRRVREAAVPRTAGREIVEGLGRWIIYLALVAVIVAAMFVPDMQELVRVPEMPEAQAFYNAVASVPGGSQVLLVMDYDASLDGELTPQARAIIWQLLRDNVGIVTVSLTPQGAAMAQDLLKASQGAAQGEDYINLGYLPSHPAALQSFAHSPLQGMALWGTRQGEAYVSQTPLGRRIAQFDDLSLIILVSGNQTHVRWWIEQVGSQHPVPMVAAVSGAIAPYIQPYYSDTPGGQLKGLLVGLAGAAAYEDLAGAQYSPNARENLVLQSYAQIVLVAIILLGGASFVVGMARKK
jgi:hypothetical protein